jgi:hypothetical protein
MLASSGIGERHVAQFSIDFDGKSGLRKARSDGGRDIRPRHRPGELANGFRRAG